MCSTKLFGLVLALTLMIVSSEAYYDRQRYKKICLAERTINDDAINMTAQELIKRSGYEYEEYFRIAKDGYITLTIRIINPLVDKEKLRQIPVMLYHGANIDSSAYLVASSIQHFPESYPSTGSMFQDARSSNRSLAFMLANNGYDVFLVGQRGSNHDNMAFTEDIEAGRRLGDSFRPTPDMYRRSRTAGYWQYGLDDVIAYDIKDQIDQVKRITNSLEVSIFSYSLSTPTTMAFLAANPNYAHNTRVYIQMAPAIAADHIHGPDYIYFEKLCPYFPTRGIGFTPTFVLKPLVRNAIIQLSRSARVTYTLIYQIVRTLFGPSQKYNTNLERNLLAHIFMPVSFKTVQHYCQNSINKRLTKFDYGQAGNLRRYNSTETPPYDVGELQVQNWMVVSGSQDGLADSTTVQRLIETTRTPSLVRHEIAPGFNHADMIGGVEVDKYVNLRVLDELNENGN